MAQETNGLFGLPQRTLLIGGAVLAALVVGGGVFALTRGPSDAGAGSLPPTRPALASPTGGTPAQPAAPGAPSEPAFGGYSAPPPAATAAPGAAWNPGAASGSDLPPGHGVGGGFTHPGSISVVQGMEGAAQAPTPSGLPDIPAGHPDYASKHGSDVPK